MPLVGAKESEERGSRHVEGRHEGPRDGDPHHNRVPLVIQRRQDLVLRPEPREWNDSGERQGAHDPGPERGWHVLAQTTHVTHVVGVDRVDRRAGAKKQKSLEGGVREQVKEARGVPTCGDRRHHVPEL